MSILAWNCRGLGSSFAVRALKDVVKASCPRIIGLLETKLDKTRCESVRLSLGFNSCFCVPARGRSGGMALMWKDDFEVNIISYSFFHIDFTFNQPGVVRATLFYGCPQSNLRHKSWELLRKLRSLSSLPWCVFGDFNEISRFSESNSINQCRSPLIDQFRRVLSDCGLFDLSFKGSIYTYSNRRKGNDEVKCRLDRAVADRNWFAHYPFSSVFHLTSHHSDHCPILLKLGSQGVRSARIFWFEMMWVRDPNFTDQVNFWWHNGSSSSALSDKLTHLSRHITVWNTKSFGNVSTQLKALKRELEDIRLQPRNDISLEKEKKLVAEIDEWLLREEQMWAQRSRVSWLCEGDNNTRFFHLKANARHRSNTIVELSDSNGQLLSGQNNIEEIALHYFRSLFVSTQRMSDEQIASHLDFIPRKVTDVHNRLLTETYTEREIMAALFQLHPTKAPGLDGFPAGFFQKYWNLIKTEFVSACLSVLQNDQFPAELNDTLIVLIPKQKNAKKMEEFRPISLTSVVSKTVAKVVVNRLQLILPEIISSAQSAFVKDRLITDNFLIAHESAHFIRNVKGGNHTYASLKLDMSKAYDRVEWSFLKNLLLKFGFLPSWVNMVMKYVSTVRYSLKINNRITEQFVPHRGLRQGDPLSPYLFIICAEWLSYNLYNLHHSGLLIGLRVCRSAPFITHLMFADDCLLLFKANLDTAGILSRLFKEYETISGQMINYNKSELVLSTNASVQLKQSFHQQLGVSIVSQHNKYLGLPLLLKRKLTLNFSGILDKFWGKTHGWISKNLSVGGKEVLIKSIIEALPQYIMNCFMFPDTVINKMNVLLRKFWWGSSSSSRRPIHWVKSAILKCVNLAFLAKQVWRIHNQPELLISKIFKARYFPNSDILHANSGYRPSFCWRSISKALDFVRRGVQIDDNGNWKWNHTSSGCFDVNSAYKFIFQSFAEHHSTSAQSSDQSQVRAFWKSFWRLPVPRKIKIFGWRGYHHGLPTGLSLCKRGLTSNVGCCICGFKIESYSHVFLNCWWARVLWKELGFQGWESLSNCDSFADILFFCWKRFTPKQFQLSLVLLWMIWCNRNRVKHGETGFVSTEALHRILSLSRQFEQFSSNACSGMRFLMCSDFVWKKPASGFIKINCDASWDEHSKQGSVGVVGRDSTGSIIGIKALPGIMTMTSSDCEGVAVLESLKMAEAMNAEKVIVESDCAEVVKWVNIKPDDTTANKGWFKGCLALFDRHINWKLFQIRREANVLADSVAKLANDNNWRWTRLDCCPRINIVL